MEHRTESEEGGAGRQNTPERIVHDVMQGIYEGRFVPGQRLVEADLSRLYHVGRGAIRDALSQLIARGVVSFARHRGATVFIPSRRELLENLAVVEALTAMSARLAAERIDAPGARDRLRAAAEAVFRHPQVSPSYEYALARRDFFDVLVALSENRKLPRLLEGAQASMVCNQLRRHAAPLAARRLEDFQAIYTAVMDGDGDRAEAAARRHVHRVSELIEALPEDFADPIHACAPRLRA